MKARIAFSLLAAGLSGCATQPHVHATPQAAPLNQASLWLNRSAAEAAQALKNLDQITKVHLSSPAVAVSHVSGVSGMTDHLSLHWSGPVNVLIEKLAQRIGWRYAFAVHPNPMPDVAIWNTNAPLPVIVHEINAQMVHVATLRILPIGRTLELDRYQPQWMPQHPVLNVQPGGPILPAAPQKPLNQKPLNLKPMNQKPLDQKPMSQKPLNGILTVGKHGALRPLDGGHYIPLKRALAHHWKLVMPAHPNAAEKEIARKWMAAGGILYRPFARP